ncbi:helix-turn-helix domain-containing protein [Brevibacillus sp. NPDC058079]|uniref:helix-turn-helix domain-containing protein n=1 Tax=Brevibacillus sp. NPDC058079 TaxID=3346330 RepID=UPI0036F12D59
MTIRDRIEELMTIRGWTKYKLAKESGLPQSTITSLFNGKVKNPSIETISKIAEAFRVSTDFLLGNKGVNFDEISVLEEGKCNKVPEEREYSQGIGGSETSLEIELADVNLLSKYMIKLDGNEITQMEWEKLLAFLRMERKFY